MLCSMFTIWNFKYTGHAEEGFLCIPVCYHLLKKHIYTHVKMKQHVDENTVHLCQDDFGLPGGEESKAQEVDYWKSVHLTLPCPSSTDSGYYGSDWKPIWVPTCKKDLAERALPITRVPRETRRISVLCFFGGRGKLISVQQRQCPTILSHEAVIYPRNRLLSHS